MGIGEYRHRVIVQHLERTTDPNGEGYTDLWSDATPATWDCQIEPATARSLERVASGTVMTTASHIVEGRHRADIGINDRLVFNGRILNITGLANPGERGIKLILTCEEVVT